MKRHACLAWSHYCLRHNNLPKRRHCHFTKATDALWADSVGGATIIHRQLLEYTRPHLGRQREDCTGGGVAS